MNWRLMTMCAAVCLIACGCNANRVNTVRENDCPVENMCAEGGTAGASVSTAELFTQIALGRADSVYQLVESGANPDGVNAEGETALLMAIEQNRVPIAKYLINAGAGINKGNASGTTPLMQVVLNGNKAIPKTLSDGTVVAIQPQTNMQQYFADLLISKGAEINAGDKKGDTALSLASSVGNLDAARYLIQRGADVNKKNLKGQTPLMIASKKGNYAIVEELIMAKADINAVDEEGQTALMYASQNDNPHLVGYLLSFGAMSEVQDQYGATAHTIADAVGNYKVMRVLKGFAAADASEE
jgi:uncharacterized protein